MNADFELCCNTTILLTDYPPKLPEASSASFQIPSLNLTCVEFIQHQMAKKETLGQVCKKFGITMEILEAYNDGLGVDSQGTTHKLRKNMTLRSIDGIRPASVNIPIAQSMARFSTEVASSGSELETKAEECTDVLQQAKVNAKQREYARLAISVITQQPGEVCYFVGMGNIVIPVDEIMALVDSNWASSWDAKSTSSGVIMGNGAALVSLVKLQKLPAHSSCEAELIAMDDIVREIAFQFAKLHFCLSPVQEGCKKFGLHWFSQLVSEDGSTWADEIQDHKQHFNGSFSYPFYSADGLGERTSEMEGRSPVLVITYQQDFRRLVFW